MVIDIFHQEMDEAASIGRLEEVVIGIRPLGSQGPSCQRNQHYDVGILQLGFGYHWIDVLIANAQIALQVRIEEGEVQMGQLFILNLVLQAKAIVGQIADDFGLLGWKAHGHTEEQE